MCKLRDTIGNNVTKWVHFHLMIDLSKIVMALNIYTEEKRKKYLNEHKVPDITPSIHGNIPDVYTLKSQRLKMLYVLHLWPYTGYSFGRDGFDLHQTQTTPTAKAEEELSDMLTSVKLSDRIDLLVETWPMSGDHSNLNLRPIAGMIEIRIENKGW